VIATISRYTRTAGESAEVDREVAALVPLLDEALQSVSDFVPGAILADDETGELLAVNFWEDEEALERTRPMRDAAHDEARALGLLLSEHRVYRVVLHGAEPPPG